VTCALCACTSACCLAGAPSLASPVRPDWYSRSLSPEARGCHQLPPTPEPRSSAQASPTPTSSSRARTRTACLGSSTCLASGRPGSLLRWRSASTCARCLRGGQHNQGRDRSVERWGVVVAVERGASAARMRLCAVDCTPLLQPRARRRVSAVLVKNTLGPLRFDLLRVEPQRCDEHVNMLPGIRPRNLPATSLRLLGGMVD
jgi:hypothetical protein